ncbi:hypothetical protein RCL1_007863 [Eukaryota sp. TZLM3-RCL]
MSNLLELQQLTQNLAACQDAGIVAPPIPRRAFFSGKATKSVPANSTSGKYVPIAEEDSSKFAARKNKKFSKALRERLGSLAAFVRLYGGIMEMNYVSAFGKTVAVQIDGKEARYQCRKTTDDDLLVLSNDLAALKVNLLNSAAGIKRRENSDAAAKRLRVEDIEESENDDFDFLGDFLTRKDPFVFAMSSINQMLYQNIMNFINLKDFRINGNLNTCWIQIVQNSRKMINDFIEKKLFEIKRIRDIQK